MVCFLLLPVADWNITRWIYLNGEKYVKMLQADLEKYVIMAFYFYFSVKPAIFDLFLAAGIVAYLGMVYLVVQVCILLVEWLLSVSVLTELFRALKIYFWTSQQFSKSYVDNLFISSEMALKLDFI